MPELFFLVERVKMEHFVYFQTDENIALLYLERIKKNQIYLNSHRYFVVCCLNTSEQKSNASVPRLMVFPSQLLFGLLTQCHLL